MSRLKFQQDFEIAALPDTVWGVISDIERYPEWAPTFERIEFPAGKTLARGLAVKMWVKGAPTATWVVSQLDEGRRFAWETTTRGVHTLADHVIEPSGTGTKLTLAVEYSGFMAKLFAPMIRKVSNPEPGPGRERREGTRGGDTRDGVRRIGVPGTPHTPVTPSPPLLHQRRSASISSPLVMEDRPSMPTSLALA